MTAPRDPDRLINAFLREGPSALGERTIERTLSEIHRSHRRSPRSLWRITPMSRPSLVAAAAVIVIGVTGALLLMRSNPSAIGNGPTPSIVESPPAGVVASPPASAEVPGPSPSAGYSPPDLQPIPSGDTSCVANVLHVAAGGVPPTDRAGLPAVVGNGRIAFVTQVGADADGLSLTAQIEVARSDSVTTIATVTSAKPFGTGHATNSLGYTAIEGWSADGSAVLVWAGRWSPSIWYHECSDLYLVRTDGTRVTRLTDNGHPGYAVWDQVMAPDGHAVAYLQATVSEVSVRVTDAAGATEVIDEHPCSSGTTALAWSPDSRYLASACDVGVVVLDDTNDTTTFRAVTGVIRALGWSADGTRLEAEVVGDSQLASAVAVDIFSGAQTTLLDLGPDSGGNSGFSPDGRSVLSVRCPAATRSDPACYAAELDVTDLGSQQSRKLWAGASDQPTNDALSSVRWNRDGSITFPDPAGHGTIVIDPVTGHTAHSDWPIGAIPW